LLAGEEGMGNTVAQVDEGMVGLGVRKLDCHLLAGII